MASNVELLKYVNDKTLAHMGNNFVTQKEYVLLEIKESAKKANKRARRTCKSLKGHIAAVNET